MTYMLLSAKAVHSGKDKEELKKNILKQKVNMDKPWFKDTSKEAKNFVNSCCEHNFKKRLSAA